MKEYKRLGAAAEFLNHPAGYLVLQFKDTDGGEFGLHPRMDDSSIYLPSPDGPAYRVAITGENPEVLERAGKALLALARKQKGESSSDDDAS